MHCVCVCEHRYGFLIAATAEELGLNHPRFASSNGCDVPRTAQQAGFAGNDEMLSFLMSHCPHCFVSPSSRNGSTPNNGRLLCNATGTFVEVDGIGYGRMPSMNCDGAESMYIDGSTTYTHISFMDKRYVGTRMVAFYDEPTSSHTVTHAEPMEEYPMHIHWKMWFTPATNSELYRDGPPPSGVGQSVVYPLVTQSAGSTKGGYLNTTACEM